jgi:hypothetical protein
MICNNAGVLWKFCGFSLLKFDLHRLMEEPVRENVRVSVRVRPPIAEDVSSRGIAPTGDDFWVRPTHPPPSKSHTTRLRCGRHPDSALSFLIPSAKSESSISQGLLDTPPPPVMSAGCSRSQRINPTSTPTLPPTSSKAPSTGSAGPSWRTARRARARPTPCSAPPRFGAKSTRWRQRAVTAAPFEV